MKLLTKTNLYYFFCALIVFAIGGLAFYYILQAFVRSEADEQLAAEKIALISNFRNKPAEDLDDIAETQNENMRLELLKNSKKISEKYYDSLVYIKAENEFAPYRICTFSAMFYGRNYKISLSKSLIESESLAEGISIATIFLFIVMLIAISTVAHFTTRKIWKPFYLALEKAKLYVPGRLSDIEFTDTKIEEFKKLNETLYKLFDKVEKDFKNLKEYSENASHEIQTPLAVIQSKLELLIQSENLNEEQTRAVKNIFEATSKLSKLNKALLLLMKIENSQFADTGNVDLSELLENKVSIFSDFLCQKNIKLEQKIKRNVTLNINAVLADLLLTNLISNAVKHNHNEGFVYIELTPGMLLIRNSGKPYTGDTEKLFERFVKDSSSCDSAGLGLSIIKKICELNGLSLSYIVENNIHILKIIF